MNLLGLIHPLIYSHIYYLHVLTFFFYIILQERMAFFIQMWFYISSYNSKSGNQVLFANKVENVTEMNQFADV